VGESETTVPIKYYPVSLSALSANIVHNIPWNMGEETIVPLARRLVKSAVQGVLVHSFGIDHIGHSLDTVESFPERLTKPAKHWFCPCPMAQPS